MNKKQEFVNMGTEIKVLVNLLTKLIKQDVEKRLKAAKVDISILGFSVLRILSHKDQVLCELGEKLILKSATLVPVVDGLEKRNLIKRVQDKKDRRRNTLAITDKGMELMKKVPLVNHDEVMVEMMEKIGKKDSERLLLILRKVVIAMGGSKEIKNIANAIKLVNAKYKK
jgi:DNA-binding MarR family transcriptional regulator